MALRLQRADVLVDPAFRTPDQDGPVERADSVFPAPMHPEGVDLDAPLTVTGFATTFKDVLPELRLATGRASGSSADLWVVSFAAGGITEVTVAPGVSAPGGAMWPRFIAPRPLFNELVARPGVQIRTLLADGTLSPDVTPTDCQGIDLEVWARRFLADVDRFLTVPYATGVYQDQTARSALDQVLAAKATLTEAIPGGLAAVLDLPDPKLKDGLREAAIRLRQQLAVSLSAAYDTATIVQYDATVTSAWTASNSQLPPARLAGNAREQSPMAGPPYTLTTAKTDLTATSSFVTFLLRLPDPARHRVVPVDLSYGLFDLEVNIANISNIDGYQSSDWLSFVPPLVGTDRPANVQTTLGSADVPIPLRAYPALPTLLGQTARPTFEQAPSPTLAQAVQWTYGLCYAHKHAEQDEVFVTATFNVPPLTRRAGQVDDVAVALAKYVAVADPLWAILAGYASPGQTDPTTLANAAQTFGCLVSTVAGRWAGRWPPLTGEPASAAGAEQVADKLSAESGVPPPRSFTFRARVTDRVGTDGKEYLATLRLTAEQDSPGPTGRWPDAFCRAPDGTNVALAPGQVQGRLLVYQFPPEPPIPAEVWPQITLEWPGLDVTAQQNGHASLAVRRNQNLLEGGPGTTAGFVYQTPSIDATDAITPLNTWDEPFDITAGGGTVQAALTSAFAELFGTATGLPLTIGMSYGYEIAPAADGGTGLATYLPVGLYPNQSLGPGTAGAIAGALAAWQSANLPARHGGEWVLSATLYSQLDPAVRRPQLAIDRLVYRIAPPAT